VTVHGDERRPLVLHVFSDCLNGATRWLSRFCACGSIA
jgi:hypothetical protein